MWVVGGLGVTLQNIEKNALSFKAKAWWMLAQNRLCPTTGDNMLSPVQIVLIVKSIAYEFFLGELLAREMRN